MLPNAAEQLRWRELPRLASGRPEKRRSANVALATWRPLYLAAVMWSRVRPAAGCHAQRLLPFPFAFASRSAR